MNERFTRAAVLAHIELSHEPDFTMGRLKVRPSLREIAGNGRREIVDPRVMQVLVALARADGGVVSRDDLVETCWGGVVVGEDAITNCVGRLRKVAEATGNAFAIETVPRVGYRLKVAETISTPEAAPVATPAMAVQGQSDPDAPPRVPVRSIAAVSTIVLLLLIAGGFALWGFWPSKPPPKSVAPVAASVAVLPFVNMSGDPKQEYLSDGFSEELVNDLANVPHLLVASRTSSFAFKGKNENVEAIARALDVHAIVEGSVRQVGNRVRITAQLIDASNGYHLWSADYTRNLTDILSLQDELARAIAAALTHRLVSATLAPRPKIDPAVYRLFLEGVHQLNEPGPQGWRRALAILTQVTIRAPDFADGFAKLSAAAIDLAVSAEATSASDEAIASAAAQRALALDPRNMSARAARGLVELNTWDWLAAASDFRILRKQNPDDYRSFVALVNYYTEMGFPDEALAQWRRLSVVQPNNYRNSFVTLMALEGAGRFRELIGITQAQLVHNPRDTGRIAELCAGYATTGQTAQASAVEERLRGLQTDSDSQSNLRNCELYIDMAAGDRADFMRLQHVAESELPYRFSAGPGFTGVSAVTFGVTYVLLGDFDKATDWFERAFERRGFFFQFFYAGGYGKAFEKYRLTAGYKALAAKPLFKKWQAEHDRIAADLAAHRDPLR
jgi:TolB-like protein/DNA-binding winged helix-turn-helix (wHTH) protein